MVTVSNHIVLNRVLIRERSSLRRSDDVNTNELNKRSIPLVLRDLEPNNKRRLRRSKDAKKFVPEIGCETMAITEPI